MRCRHIVPVALLTLTVGVAHPTPALAATQSATPTTALVSLTTDGYQFGSGPSDPHVSSDGSIVTWSTWDDVNPQTYIRDNTTGITERLDTDASGNPLGSHASQLRLSASGTRAVFVESPTTSEEHPATRGEFLVAKNLVTGEHVELSEHVGNLGAISDDGNVVAWEEMTYDIATGNMHHQLMVEDLRVGVAHPVLVTTDGKPVNNQILVADMSSDGSTIAFCSGATNLDARVTVTNSCQPYTVPTTGGAAHLVATPSGAIANDYTFLYDDALDYSGDKLAFTSGASNWTPGDKNANQDVFVADLNTGAVARQTLTSTGAYAYGGWVHIKPDGSTVMFSTEAALLPEDTNGDTDVYSRVIATGALSRLPIGHNTKRDYSILGFVVAAGWQHVAFSSYDDVVVGDLNQNLDVFLLTLPGASSAAPVAAPTSSSSATISWANPADFSDAHVRIARTEAPESETEGTALYTGAGASTTATGLAPNTTYGVAIFTKDASGTTLSRKVASFRTPLAPVTTTFTRTTPASTTVTFGNVCTVNAVLKNAQGNPVSGVDGDVLTRPPGTTTWTRVAGFYTSTTGVATYYGRPSGHRYVHFRFRGTETLTASSSGTQSCLVKPVISITPSASTVKYGSALRVTGSVKPGKSGSIVYLQRYYSGAWRNHTSVKTTSTGAYAVTFHPAKGKFSYRISKPAVTDLTAAQSRTVSLTAS